MAQGISPASGHGATIDLAPTFPIVSPVLLKKRSRPIDHWHTSLESTSLQQQQQHGHGHRQEPQHQLHHPDLGQHVRKKHVTEAMAIDFELLSLESGHLRSPSLGHLRVLQEEYETPASPLSPTQISPTPKQAPHDDTEFRAGFGSDTSALSAAVDTMCDADHEMGMDLTEDGERLHDGHGIAQCAQLGGSSGHGTLSHEHMSEHHEGRTTKNHHLYASGATASTLHTRGHSTKPNNTNMRQRKWNSATKTWQEWRDVPETQALDRMAPHLIHGQLELTSSQDPQNTEVSDSEFSDIEDLGIRRSTTTYGRQQQRLYSSAMDFSDIAGKGRAAYVSNIAFGKSKK
ncbi:hypothetical protein DFQ27_003191 [Actinomortierella ambigua]|uniref:Uncharacterized protein n=1 Tax=Actinomortierella ambigua TaxID=1343610 RepID=A0A9P6UCS5_9FUNG|nr:hypothetical protein DFQ27_003191 [Actinomortierella ambigua]